jgi:hypothetical protein
MLDTNTVDKRTSLPHTNSFARQPRAIDTQPYSISVGFLCLSVQYYQGKFSWAYFNFFFISSLSIAFQSIEEDSNELKIKKFSNCVSAYENN